MPVNYKRDDHREHTEIAIVGAFDASEVLACVEQHRSAGYWHYRVLYDLRYMTGPPTMDTLRDFARTLEPRSGEPPRGPVAIVTIDPVMYSRACAYASMVEGLASIHVFTDRAEADTWLERAFRRVTAHEL